MSGCAHSNRKWSADIIRQRKNPHNFEFNFAFGTSVFFKKYQNTGSCNLSFFKTHIMHDSKLNKLQFDEKRGIISLIHKNITSQTLILQLDFQKSPSSWKLFKTASLDPPQKLPAHSRSSSLAMLLGMSPST